MTSSWAFRFVHSVCLIAVALAMGALPASAEESACLANASRRLSYFNAGVTATFQDFPGVATADAFQRVYRALLRDGWTILHADRDLGGISASSNNSPASVHLIVEPLGGEGSRVSISLKITEATIEGRKRQALCDILAATAG